MRSKRSTPVRVLRGQPGGRRAEAAFRVDRAGGAGPGCARTGAGGTPALPGGPPPTLLLHKEARAGLPGRSPADAAEPSCLVSLRGSLFFSFVSGKRRPPARPRSLHSEQPGRVVPEDVFHLGVAEAFGPAGPLEGAQVLQAGEHRLELQVFFPPMGGVSAQPEKRILD